MNLGNGAPVNRDSDSGLTRIDPIGDQPALARDARSAALPPTHTLIAQSTCGICDGAGWLKEAVPFGHPHFGLLFPCQCKRAEWMQRTAEELARLSNLDAVGDKTFATFNPFIPGLRDLVPPIRSYARRPDGWLTLLGPYGVGKTHLAAAIAHEGCLLSWSWIILCCTPDCLTAPSFLYILLEHSRSS